MEFKLESSDERREIYANSELLSTKKEISFIKLKKGKAIGGCKHSCQENFVVWEGRVMVVTKAMGQKYSKLYCSGESGIFPAGVAHMMIGESDALISEWGVSTEEKKQNKKDEELLSHVKRING
jgi:mannose-6-phosphate isomerase-like protein (cupin superfamily)